MLWSWILTALLAGLSYWWYWRWTHRRMLELANKIPGPPALPILGNALFFMANPAGQLTKISCLINKYGQYCKFWLGPELNVCVKNPTDVRLLLTSNKVNQKGTLYEFMKPFIGPGILTGGPTWRNHRKIATPSYHKKAVQCYAAVFNREAEYLAQRLSGKDPESTFDVYFDVLFCTTQSVCQTLMGLSKEESLHIKRLEEVILETQSMYSFVFTNITRWWFHIPPIYWLSGRKFYEIQYVRKTYEMVADIVSKRREALKSGLEDQDGMGVVDRFILDGSMTDNEVIWETFSLFTTSQEAAAKVTSGVLLVLAHLPDWQEDKVYKEILEVLGPHDEEVTDEQIKKLQYLDMVYKETLRYLAIAAFIQRNVEEEITIDNGNITLPAGTSLIIPIHVIHRDPQYWEEPYKIKPERFLPENVKKRDPNVFVPFSLGAMDCLGRVYATSLIKTVVVRVLRKVQLSATGSIEDLDLHVAISVKFAKGYNLRCSPRKAERDHDSA